MKVKELMLKCEELEQRNLEMIEKYEWALDVKQKYIEKLEKEIEELKE